MSTFYEVRTPKGYRRNWLTLHDARADAISWATDCTTAIYTITLPENLTPLQALVHCYSGEDFPVDYKLLEAYPKQMENIG